MYIVADIGGTKTRVAAAAGFEHFRDPIVYDTPASYEQGLEMLFRTIAQVSHGEPVSAIAAGLPALLSGDKRSIIDATNLPEWSGKDFAQDLESRVPSDVVLENDVSLVGIGEAVFGAGAGMGRVVYITVSTGVNGVLVIDGTIDPSYRGTSMGRQYVSMEEPLINFEDLISGRSIERRFGTHPKDLGKDSPIWEKLAAITSFGVHNAILFWRPDIVILGGSMFNEIGIPVELVNERVKNIWTASPTIPDIVHSRLGDLGGLYGGLARLRQIQ